MTFISDSDSSNGFYFVWELNLLIFGSSFNEYYFIYYGEIGVSN